MRTGLVALSAAVLLMGGAGCQSDRGSARNADPLPGTVGAGEAPAAQDQGDPVGLWYEVEAGDTLWDISQRHNVPVDELVEVNGLASPDLLAAGQLLFIPDDRGLSLEGERAGPDVHASARAVRGPPAPVTSSAELMWPMAAGVLLRDFDEEREVPYEGILLAAPAGTPVSAAAAGHVAFVGNEENRLGRMIIIRHGEGLLTIYAHLDAVRVEAGRPVDRGQLLGSVGTTGRAESPQLHFQVRRGRTAVDPLAHLPPP